MRHVPEGEEWHKATDQLRGTDVYGDPDIGLGTQFSLRFDTEDYNQVHNAIMNDDMYFEFHFAVPLYVW